MNFNSSWQSYPQNVAPFFLCISSLLLLSGRGTGFFIWSGAWIRSYELLFAALVMKWGIQSSGVCCPLDNRCVLIGSMILCDIGAMSWGFGEA